MCSSDLCKRTRPGRKTNTKAVGFPFTSISLFPPFVLRLAPTHLGWDTRRQFTRRSKDPPGSKRRQLARQVGACCVLTNNFPSSSRWAVSSNLSSPGQCSVSGVLSSCPWTAVDTSGVRGEPPEKIKDFCKKQGERKEGVKKNGWIPQKI